MIENLFVSYAWHCTSTGPPNPPAYLTYMTVALGIATSNEALGFNFASTFLFESMMWYEHSNPINALDALKIALPGFFSESSKNSPQCLHFLAIARIDSPQNGQAFSFRCFSSGVSGGSSAADGRTA